MERQPEHRMIQILLLMLGLSATAIGLMVFVLGEQAVYVVESMFDSLTGQTAAASQIISPTIDSELRFYATLWVSYGIVLIQVARTIMQRVQFVPILGGIFFIGGVGRVLSYLFVGAPHPMFTLLMLIELVYPVLLAVPYLRLKNRNLMRA